MGQQSHDATVPLMSQSKRKLAVWLAIIPAVAAIIVAVISLLGQSIGHGTPSSVPTKTPSFSTHPDQPSAPKLEFVPQSSGTVSWCTTFYIKASRQLPNGYKILIFDASADTRFLVTSNYNYDGVVTPVTGVSNEWETGHVWVSSDYKQDASGHYIIRNGKKVSNAGYTAAVFAVLVPNSVSQTLTHVDVKVDNLPPGQIAEAQFHAMRNGDIQKRCSPFAGT